MTQSGKTSVTSVWMHPGMFRRRNPVKQSSVISSTENESSVQIQFQTFADFLNHTIQLSFPWASSQEHRSVLPVQGKNLLLFVLFFISPEERQEEGGYEAESHTFFTRWVDSIRSLPELLDRWLDSEWWSSQGWRQFPSRG